MNTEYPKIDTLFKRDERGIIIPDSYTIPEFEYLRNVRWEATEKIDGTNIRVIVECILEDNIKKYKVTFKGRTDKSVPFKPLYEHLANLFSNIDWEPICKFEPGTTMVLYGEGYGHKLQTPGDRYDRKDVHFILFDIKLGDWWLTRASCENIAQQLNIDIVPLIGEMTLEEAITWVNEEHTSLRSQDPTLVAEGLVLKAPCGILKRDGKRLITKIKIKDFKQLANK